MQYFLRVLFFILPLTVFLSACDNLLLSEQGAEMAQVPITDHPTGKISPGQFVWHDLLTPDIHSAGQFYTALFGWEVEYHDTYAVVTHNGRKIAGLVQQKESVNDHNTSGIWIPSVSVTNVDQAVQLVKELKGEVINAPVNMASRGRASLIKDPLGAYIVLLRAKGGDPIKKKAVNGDWLWDEVWTKQPDTSEVFYATLLGFDEVALINNYQIFMSQGKWLAGLRDVQDDSQASLWIPVIKVADPKAMVKKVTELGGVVWVTPDEAPDKNNTALISDTTGALLLIQKWTSQSSIGGIEK